MNSLLAVGQVRKHASGLPIAFAARAFLVASLIGVGFVVAPAPAHACSCVENLPPPETLERSAVVFAGRVVSLKLHERQGEVWSGSDPVTVEFEVSSVWKGTEYQTMYLTTARSGATCGFTFVEGEEYLVYSSNTATVSLCSRTRSISEADEDLAALGEGRSPTAGAVGPTPAVPDLPEIPLPVRPEEPTASPSEDSGSEGRGAGCSLGSKSTEIWFMGMMAGVVWFGVRKRCR